MASRPDVDWGAVERHYRANRKSLNEIAREYGVSRPAITNRAKKEGWVRDLEEKIEQDTRNRVAMGVAIQELASNLPPETRLADSQVVALNGQAGAKVELTQRATTSRVLAMHDTLLGNLEGLANPRLHEILQWIADQEDRSTPAVADRANEAYRYAISLPGLIKMAKDLAAAHQVYLLLQRKIHKLDEGKGAAPFEDLLARLGSAAEGG